MKAVAVATPDQRPTIDHLLAHGTRRQVNLGDEDLQMLLEAGGVYLSVDGDRALGVVAVQVEAPPPSLPASTPSRAYVRAVAFGRGASPSVELHHLLTAWRAGTYDIHGTPLLIAYGDERWLSRALTAAGLHLAEEVVFFALHNLARRTQEWQFEGPASLRNAQPDELDHVAALDAATFNLLWHLPARQLSPLLLRGRLQVALIDGTLAGYAAMTVRDDVAQVARLAVHPAWQGRGIGRQLMVDSLLAAVELGCTAAVLNTQLHNDRSQQLYRSLGFRPTGERFGTYTLG